MADRWRAGALAIVGALGLLFTTIAAQAPPSRLAIVFPPAESYVSGPLVIRVQVDPPSVAVRRVSFFADGRLVCTVERPPFVCDWDAGEGVRAHAIRAVAELADGTRLVHNVRTRDAGFTERVDVDAIQVTAVVTDANGEFVTGLTREDFRLFENGVPQDIEVFQSENIPLELVAAVDVSNSMTDAMPTLKEAVRHFLTALRAEDQVTLLSFNDNIFTLVRRSQDPGPRARAVDRFAPWGGTALYDAVLKGVDLLGQQAGRRALVVFTDGEDQSSYATLAQVEARMETSDATLYTIGQGRGVRQESLRTLLQNLARRSGGRAFLSDDLGRLREAFAAIVEELSHQYLLTYTPSNPKQDGTWREIEVEVSGGTYRVRARQGYRAREEARW